MREKITLACEVCKQRNYDTMKSKKIIRIELSLRNIANSARRILFIRKQSNLFSEFGKY